MADGGEAADPIKHERQTVLTLGVREKLGGNNVFCVPASQKVAESNGDRRADVRRRGGNFADDFGTAVDDGDHVFQIMAGHGIAAAPIREGRELGGQKSGGRHQADRRAIGKRDRLGRVEGDLLPLTGEAEDFAPRGHDVDDEIVEQPTADRRPFAVVFPQTESH